MLNFIICAFISNFKNFLQFPFPINLLYKDSSSKEITLSKDYFATEGETPDFSDTKMLEKNQYFTFGLPARKFFEKRLYLLIVFAR